VNIKDKIIEFYGNRGYKFDLLISIILVIIFLIFRINIDFAQNVTKYVNESTISFLGIVVGFLLTTFSLLFLYEPKTSEKLKRVREMKVYKSMLSSFISTALIIILFTIFTLLINGLSYFNIVTNIILFVGVIFSILRILKCIFYLYAIIELS
jgi:hypothetical protein